MTSEKMRELASNGWAGLSFALDHGSEAARLLADAHFVIANAPLNDDNDPTGEGREIAGEWLARFAALGEPQEGEA